MIIKSSSTNYHLLFPKRIFSLFFILFHFFRRIQTVMKYWLIHAPCFLFGMWPISRIKKFHLKISQFYSINKIAIELKSNVQRNGISTSLVIFFYWYSCSRETGLSFIEWNAFHSSSSFLFISWIINGSFKCTVCNDMAWSHIHYYSCNSILCHIIKLKISLTLDILVK